MDDLRSLGHAKRKRKYHAITFRVRLKRTVRGVVWQAALSGPPVQPKAPGFAGGYLPSLRSPPGSAGEGDPFLTYWGDEPYFRRAESRTWTLRGSAQRQLAHLTLHGGVSATADHVSLFEVDDPVSGISGIDTLRSYDASVPGGAAFAQVRWEREGMVVSGGLRAQRFSAGPQARAADGSEPPAVWSWSPRLGLTYPLSVRDAFSASYVRIDQPPDRDLLYEDRDPGLPIVNRRPLGNGSIRPSTVISYQGAVKHLFGPRWASQFALFYRDLWGLVGIRDASPMPVLVKLQYVDNAAGHAAGFEASLLHADAARLQAELHYTFMNAWGTHSNPEGTPFGPVVRDRLIPIGEHPLNWDIHHIVALSLLWQRPGAASVSWSTLLHSGAPWTPRQRRTIETDEVRTNGRRFGWGETSSLAMRGQLRALPGLWFGLDVRNVFDWRGDILATLDGHPHPRINTLYDDYGAYRTETGLGGGAYYEDLDGDGTPEWVPVHDPRLANPPRSIRFMAGVRW